MSRIAHLFVSICRVAAGDTAEGPDHVVVAYDAEQRLRARLSKEAQKREVVAERAAVQIPLICRLGGHCHKIHVEERERHLLVGHLCHQLGHATLVESTMPKQ